jgi:hypothetical protein
MDLYARVKRLEAAVFKHTAEDEDTRTHYETQRISAIEQDAAIARGELKEPDPETRKTIDLWRLRPPAAPL